MRTKYEGDEHRLTGCVLRGNVPMSDGHQLYLHLCTIVSLQTQMLSSQVQHEGQRALLLPYLMWSYQKLFEHTEWASIAGSLIKSMPGKDMLHSCQKNVASQIFARTWMTCVSNDAIQSQTTGVVLHNMMLVSVQDLGKQRDFSLLQC